MLCSIEVFQNGGAQQNFSVVLNRNVLFPVEFSSEIAVFLWNFAKTTEKEFLLRISRCSIETFVFAQ